MLVLTRKYNQSIMIGDAIEIVVVDIKGDQVKLGIRAPRECTILRSEIYQQIREENALASSAPPDALDRFDRLLAPPKPAAGAPPAPRRPAIILRKPPEPEKK